MPTTRTSQSILNAASRGVLAYNHISILRSCAGTNLQQVRASSFLNDSSIPSRNREPPSTARESWFARRRKLRNTRSKISTLALDSQQIGMTADQAPAQTFARRTQKAEDQEKTEPTTANRRLTSRRLILWCTILSMPIWGQDILEVVIPGLLGILIFVASNIKKGVNWVKSPFRSPASARWPSSAAKHLARDSKWTKFDQLQWSKTSSSYH